MEMKIPSGAGTTPHTLIISKTIDYNQKFQIEFSEYIQIHDKHDSNTTSRIIGTFPSVRTETSKAGIIFSEFAAAPN